MSFRKHIKQRFLPGLRSHGAVQYAISVKRRVVWDALHLVQSELDGACGPLCAIQAAMILTGFRRKAVEKIAQTKSGELHGFWKLAQREYFNGTTAEDLERLIAVFPTLRSKVIAGHSVKRIGRAIAKAINCGHVAILGVENEDWSHWTLVVGIERVGKKSQPQTLLCLDSSDGAPWGVMYSSRCALTTASLDGNKRPRRRKRYPLRYRDLDGRSQYVRLNDVVVVKRA